MAFEKKHTPEGLPIAGEDWFKQVSASYFMKVVSKSLQNHVENVLAEQKERNPALVGYIDSKICHLAENLFRADNETHKTNLRAIALTGPLELLGIETPSVSAGTVEVFNRDHIKAKNKPGTIPFYDDMIQRIADHNEYVLVFGMHFIGQFCGNCPAYNICGKRILGYTYELARRQAESNTLSEMLVKAN